MTFRLIVAAALAAVTAGVTTAAQAPAAGAAQQPTFRAGVELVEVQAVVTDKQGNPVTGLTQDDFEIVENGKPQTIAAFSTVDIPIERDERPLFSPTAIEPDIAGNAGPEGRVYLIAFDEVHPLYALRTRHFLRQFIERHVGANDSVAIAYFSVGARNSQEFTSNKRVILQALEKFTGGIPGETALIPEASPAPVEQPDPGGLMPSSTGDAEAKFKIRGRTRAFREVVEFLATVPGQRKALLFISAGIGNDVAGVIDYQGGVMPIEMEDAHAAIRTAATGNIAIYPIDPRGLQADGGAEQGSFEEAQAAATPAAVRLAQISNARMLAETTGGFAFQNRNDYEQAFSRLVRENSSYYALGFYSTNDRRDGRFRRLNVRVKRPGLEVRSRTGYLGPRGRQPAAAPPAKPTVLSAATSAALTGARPARGLPMKLFAAPFKGQDKTASVALALSVDPAALELAQKDGIFSGKLEIALAATSNRAGMAAGEYHNATLSLKPDTFQRSSVSGIHVLGELKLPPGLYQIRAALGNGGGKTGSVIYDLEVPDFSKGPLTMSGVALVSRQHAGTLTITTKNPLRDFLPAPPTTVREFSADDTLVVFAEFYDNLKTASTHTVDLKATLRADDGREIRNVAEQRSSGELTGAAGGFGFRADLSLEDTPPGLYVIHVEARANTGGQPSISRDVSIRIK